MQNLVFTAAWNGSQFHNKIHCKYFTTLRLPNEKKYVLNERYAVYLSEKCIKSAKLIKITPCTLTQLTDTFFHLDTGYNKETSINIFKRIYRLKDNDEASTIFWLMLYETV